MRVTPVLAFSAYAPPAKPRFGESFDVKLLSETGDFKPVPGGILNPAFRRFFQQATHAEANAPIAEAGHKTPIMLLATTAAMPEKHKLNLLKQIDSKHIDFSLPYAGEGPDKGKPVLDFVTVADSPQVLRGLLISLSKKPKALDQELQMLFGDKARFIVGAGKEGVSDTWTQGLACLKQVAAGTGLPLKKLVPILLNLRHKMDETQKKRFNTLITLIYALPRPFDINELSEYIR